MTETIITGVDYGEYREVEVIIGETQVIEVNTGNTLVVESDSGVPEVVEVIGSVNVVEATTGEKGPAPKFLSGTAPQPTDGTAGDVYIISSAGSNPGDVYQKDQSGWGIPITNIRGATGLSGVINSINGKTGTTVVLAASDITTGVLPIAQVPTGTTATTVALGNHNHDSVYARLVNSNTFSGQNTFTSTPIMDVGGPSLSLKAGATADHTYMQFFARSSTPSTRNAYLGFGSAAGNTFTIQNEISGGQLFIRTNSGTIVLDNHTQVTGNLAVTATLKIGTSATAGHVLTTDASGNASWQQGQDPIPLGTTAQYYRGDKTWQTLNATAVGLGSVTNAAQVTVSGTQTITGAKTYSVAPVVPDASFAIVKIIGLQSALDSKSPTASPTFTGTVTGTFSGSGAALTGLNAANVSTGTLAIARIPTGVTSSTVALGDHNHDAAYVGLAGNQTIAGTKTFSSAPVVPDSAFSVGKTSGLQAALDGKAPLDSPSFSGAVAATVTSSVTIINNTAGTSSSAAALNLQSASDYPSVFFRKISGGATDGKLQLNVPLGRFEVVNATGSAYIDFRALNLYGAGANITALNASNLGSGTVPQARVTQNVQRFVFTTGTEARPTGSTYVEWMGPVQPANALLNDTWINTA